MRTVALLLCFLFVLLQIVSFADAHAVLIRPKPWCSWANRNRPCGFPTMPLNNHSNWDSVVAYYKAGQKYSFLWYAENGDGLGNVQGVVGQFDDDGTPRFNNATNLIIDSHPIYNPGWYYWNLTIPESFNCTSQFCPVQLHAFSGGGWYSCFTAKILCSTCDFPTSCASYSTVNNGICSKYIGDQQVTIPHGSSLQNMETDLNTTYNRGLKRNGFNNSPACQSTYLQFLCQQEYVPCSGVVNATYSACQHVLDVCGSNNMTFCDPYIIDISSDSASPTTGSSVQTTTSKSSDNPRVAVPLFIGLVFALILVLLL